MDHEFRSIVEKLAILEGRLDPTDSKPLAETKQKKPALFTNLKKDESAIPMVGGVEFAEDKQYTCTTCQGAGEWEDKKGHKQDCPDCDGKGYFVDVDNIEEDILGKVKASLADYLKSAEENIKQDKDLIAKKKQDLDLKKKELKDLTLQTKQQTQEAIPNMLEDHQKLEVGDRIMVMGPNHYQGEFGEVAELSPSGKFVVVRFHNGDEASMHISDVEYHDDQEDFDDDEDWEDDLDEDPNQTPAGGEGRATLADPTYAESFTAPVKTINVPKEEVGLSGGGGSVLVEIHGDERNGFCIKRAGKELPTRFKSLEECEIALEMFMARLKKKHDAEQSADYIEEK